jgi:AraC-like DNA-binding protein
MNLFNDIIVTEIQKPFTVFSKKGRTEHTENRLFYGLSFCLDGQITYKFVGKEFVSNKNNAVILPKGATYSLHGDKEGLFPLINFNAQNFSCDSFIVIPLEHSLNYINDFNKLSDYFLREDKYLRIYSLFYHMLERLNLEESHTQNPLYPVINYLEKNISNPEITNVFLAKKLGISEVYLRKLFSVHYGTSPRQFIIDMRIQKAKSLLTNGTHTITSISEECGFSSLYHFCRIFKEKTGYTPSEYAANNQNFII